MQIPWLFPDFSQYSFFSLTFNKIPWLFPDFCQVWNFPDFSLTAGHPVLSKPMLAYYSIGPLTTNFSEILIKTRQFFIQEYEFENVVYKNDSHFVSASMC